MNTITKLQVEFSKPTMPRPIPVRQAQRRLPMALVDANLQPGSLPKVAGFYRGFAEVDPLIATIRRALGKSGQHDEND